MSLESTFIELNPEPVRVEAGLQISITTGDTKATIIRTSLEDNINGDNLVFDTVRPKVFKRPNNLIVVKGSVKIKMYWEEADNIQAADIDRMKELNANDPVMSASWSESSTSDALTNREYITTYAYGPDYTQLSNKAGAWKLATNVKLEATEDDTRLFCVNSDTHDWNVKIIDVPVGETRTLAKQETDNYVFFSQNCSIGETQIAENSVRKLTSNSVDITNQANMAARVIIVSR
tara:strand:+ start:3824 stop:4525 length:702 start_codon:yes stop_codon:yes gene_type:complete